MLCQRPETRKYDFSILRSATPLSHEQFNQLAAAFPRAAIYGCYGLTEAGVISMEITGAQSDKSSISGVWCQGLPPVSRGPTAHTRG